ncbi:TraR/DksA family transcriptional regulator [Patescibacteria group bacterium AH-259-L07]|nr:TraR/DksA family transcriptional regulator [Patescibacteria group bacterium AH-259-L07]
MFKKFVASKKKDLQERRHEIKKQLESIAEKSTRVKNDYEARFPEYGRAEDENADEVANFVDSLSLENNLENALAEVEAALKKIAKNEYGICEDCGKEMSKKRLEALPTAQYCIDCKDKNHGSV